MMLNAIYEINYDLNVKRQIPVKDFKLIEDSYATEPLYVLTDKESEKKLYDFINLIDSLENIEEIEERNEILLKIEQNKGALKKYQITLNENDMNPYLDYIENCNSYYRFVPFSNIDKVYDRNKGFIKLSKQASATIQL